MAVSQSAAARCPIGARVVARYGAPLARGGWSRADHGELLHRGRGWVRVRVGPPNRAGVQRVYRLRDLGALDPYTDDA